MNNTSKQWMLPSGIEEALPEQAWQIERLRQKILRLFNSWGYDLVITPMFEYLESLLVISDEALNRHTLKVVDQLNGQMMGLRPDITPQVARIDAHRMHKQGSNRLCYIGTVLHAQAMDVTGTRVLTQFGAEIYGHAGVESDAEVILLMLESLRTIGVAGKNLKDVYVELGHIGIYSALVEEAGLNAEQSARLLGLVQMKSAHEIHAYLNELKAKPKQIENFIHLVEMHGGPEVINKIWQAFDSVKVRKIINQVKKLSQCLHRAGVSGLNYDFSDLDGYHYETGVVFTAFHKDIRCPIVRGGRYDDIGAVFGRARPATGFSGDLKLLASMVAQQSRNKQSIFAPISKDMALQDAVQSLRKKGTRVVFQLNKKEHPQMLGCNYQLVLRNKQWKVEAV